MDEDARALKVRPCKRYDSLTFNGAKAFAPSLSASLSFSQQPEIRDVIREVWCPPRLRASHQPHPVEKSSPIEIYTSRVLQAYGARFTRGKRKWRHTREEEMCVARISKKSPGRRRGNFYISNMTPSAQCDNYKCCSAAMHLVHSGRLHKNSSGV